MSSANAFPKPSEVIKRVCQLTGVSLGDLVSSSRHRDIIRARRIAVGCCRELTHASLPEIAKAMSRYNHSSIYIMGNDWLRCFDAAERSLIIEQVTGDGLSGRLAPIARVELAERVKELERRDAKWYGPVNPAKPVKNTKAKAA